MIRATTRSTLRQTLDEARSGGRRIGLVPTMGYLHEGHLSLIDYARQRSDLVVVSVFVNPLQFGENEDFSTYPRDIERDAGMARGRGTDVLFVPADEEMYPSGAVEVVVDAPRLAQRLCGAFRPGHFRGVLTVVAKLLGIVAPDLAVFGRKDYQQLALIRRMVRDLDMPVEIAGGPIVREPDGLALSSRNIYLGPEEREQATRLSRGLRGARDAFVAGNVDAASLAGLVAEVLDGGPLVRTQYVEVVSPDDLSPVTTARSGDIIAVAAHVGATRLIDNIELAAGP